MPRRLAVSVNRRERSQPLGKIESLCCRYLDPRQPLTVGVPELLVLESAVSEISQPSVWDAVSDRALPGLLGIYALSIRHSSPLLEPCSATEAQHHASVRGALSEQLSNVPDSHRARQIALSILRGQVLHCYAVLLADAASSLARQASKRNMDSADALMRELNDITWFIADESESDTGSPPSELLRTLQAEVLASSLLEHWARLLLTLADCEGRAHAHAAAAVHLQRFSAAQSATMKRIGPDCSRRLLASSPCLSYLLASQLVALCAILDGGTVYGMPEAPGGVLAASVLAPRLEGRGCDRSALVSLEPAVWLAMGTLAALPPLPGCRLLPGAEPAPASQPTGGGDDAALAARVAPLAVPDATTASIAGVPTTAESHAQSQSQSQPSHTQSAEFHTSDSGATPSAAAEAASVPCGAAPAEGPQFAGHTAATLQPYTATGQTTFLPTLLLNPMVRLEVSLRLVAALCRKLAPTQFEAQDGIEEDYCPDAGQPRWLRQLREVSSSLPTMAGLKGAFNALRSAGQVLSNAEFPGARPRPWRMATRTARDSATRGSVALSPLQRWWGGAVAMGRAVAGAAAAAAEMRADSELAQEFVIVMDNYFWLLERMMEFVLKDCGPPAQQPSESVAAALTTGFLPCLEGLLRAVLPLPLPSEWARRLGWRWDAAWSQMLAFADAGEVAAVVDAGAEGLRREVAACSAACQSQEGSSSISADSPCVLQLENAVHLACHLTGNLASTWLPLLAAEPASEASSPDGDGSDAVARTAVTARLGESLSLVVTRLLPEVSRALVGGLLPLLYRGVVELDWMCLLLGRQLEWVQMLAAALAGSASPAAAAAAADGSTGGSGCNSGGGAGASGGGACAVRWRQLLFVELRLPSLLGAALDLSLGRVTAEESESLDVLRKVLCAALWALAVLVPADLARMVAAADRAETAAACRTAASRRPAGATGAAAPPAPSPPSSGLLRRALGPGGPLEDAELLAAVEAACAGRVGSGADMPGCEGRKDGLPPDMEQLLLGARLLSL